MPGEQEAADSAGNLANKNSRFVTLLSSPSNSSLGGDSAHASGAEDVALASKRKKGHPAKVKAPKSGKDR